MLSHALQRARALPVAFYGVSTVLLLATALPLPVNGKIQIIPSLCPFFNLTGLPCAGCGLTRSFVCLAHGHVSEAFVWHPLGPLLFLAGALYLLGTLKNVRWPAEKWLVGTLCVSLLLFWGLRLGGFFPFPV